jgi:hypothetical protein
VGDFSDVGLNDARGDMKEAIARPLRLAPVPRRRETAYQGGKLKITEMNWMQVETYLEAAIARWFRSARPNSTRA